MKQFEFRVEIIETLTEDEIWPDGDGPENPTAEDARQRFLESCRGDVLYGLNDWNLLPGQSDLAVTDIEAHKLDFAQRVQKIIDRNK